jgi:acyl-CoA thioester hydrolase
VETVERSGLPFVDVQLRVRYAETDRMGVVYYANYLVWFEIGRSEYCRQQGFNYIDMEREGYRLVVTEARCTYRQSARYDDLVTVRTVLHQLRRRSLTFRYVVFRNGADDVMVRGETSHHCLDDGGRARTIPQRYYALLGHNLQH